MRQLRLQRLRVERLDMAISRFFFLLNTGRVWEAETKNETKRDGVWRNRKVFGSRGSTTGEERWRSTR